MAYVNQVNRPWFFNKHTHLTYDAIGPMMQNYHNYILKNENKLNV